MTEDEIVSTRQEIRPPGVLLVRYILLDSLPEAAWERLRAVLSAEERASAEYARNEETRRERIAGRGALRLWLGELLGADPATLKFSYSLTGKPELAGTDICFNLAHSHGLVAAAFTRGRAVGLDVEWRSPTPPDPESFSECLTAAERAGLYALPPELLARGFYRAWACKEAYLKGTGEGVAGDILAFSVETDPRRPPALFLPPARQKDGWRLYPLELGEEYECVAAVAGEVEVRMMKGLEDSQ